MFKRILGLGFLGLLLACFSLSACGGGGGGDCGKLYGNLKTMGEDIGKKDKFMRKCKKMPAKLVTCLVAAKSPEDMEKCDN